MREICIPLPPLPVQRRIVDVMTHLDKEIAGIEGEVSALVTLRSQLLSALLSRDLELLAAYDSVLDEVM